MPAPESRSRPPAPMALPPTRDDLAAELKVFIPKVGRWKHDSSCSLCGVEFSYLRGRHHCRYCGASVCGKHSRNRAVVPSSMSTEKQRVCDICYPKCQYGIPLQRRRGYTTVSGGPANFTLLDVRDSDDPRSQRSERGRARTIAPTGQPQLLRAYSRPSRASRASSRDESGSYRSWNPQKWQDEQAAHSQELPPRRRRGTSEPPERIVATNAVPATTKAPPPSPPPVSPQTRKSISNGVFQMSPRKQKRMDSPLAKKKSPKTLSIRKHYESPPPPPQKKQFGMSANRPLDESFAMSDFMSSFASIRDTKEEDEIAMQYLQSFIKGETLASVQETNHVTVSHSNSGPLIGMTTVFEMTPASPKELQLTGLTPPPSETASPPLSRNRKRSTSSSGTVSASDSEEQDEEKAQPTVATSDDEESDELFPTDELFQLASAAALTVEVNTAESSKSVEEPPRVSVKEAKAKRGSVRFADDCKPCEPEPSEEGIRLMHEIMDLEQQIQQCQSELPALLDEWQRIEHIASLLRADARESRDKVLQYQKARALVTRALRVGAQCLADKEYEAAVLELSHAVAVERTNAKAWYLLAQGRFHLGQLAEAEEACRVSAELQPSAVGVALLGRILHARGRHDEAIQCYLTALGREVEI